MTYHLVPWNSMELWDCHFIQCHATLEFHGIYYGIPWNSIEWPNKKSPSSMGFHGIRRTPFQMTHVPWNPKALFHGSLVPPNEISLSSMEFHGTWRLSFYSILCYPGLPWDIPWNSISNVTGVPWNSMEYSMEFHGSLVPPNEISISSMEFHGIFHGIPWNSGAAKWHIT